MLTLKSHDVKLRNVSVFMKALVTVKCCLLFKVELSRELHMLQLGASVGFSASRDEGRAGVGERILLSPLLF